MSFPVMPGIPAAGHVDRSGYWHPGSPDGCPKGACSAADERAPRRRGVDVAKTPRGVWAVWVDGKVLSTHANHAAARRAGAQVARAERGDR